MAKRIFAALGILLMLTMPVRDLRAQLTPIAVDGCAKLARVIYTEVFSATLYGPGKSGPWIIDQGQGEVSVCTHAAKTVSQAFSSAMLSAGYAVDWPQYDNSGIPDRGHLCLSAFLSQCYPERYPLSAVSFDADSERVFRSWSAVSQAVMGQMYNPISSDEVRFRDSDLRLRLGLSLRLVNVRDGH
jgi:hypothetical protein